MENKARFKYLEWVYFFEMDTYGGVSISKGQIVGLRPFNGVDGFILIISNGLLTCERLPSAVYKSVDEIIAAVPSLVVE